MNFTVLLHTIQQTHSALQQQAIKAINRSLTIRNWLIGFYIVEFEQNGEDRAKYGEGLLEVLSAEIKKRGIKGLTRPELTRCRQFYNLYPQIRGTLSHEFADKYLPNSVTLSHKSLVQKEKAVNMAAPIDKLLSDLSFSHIAELIKIEDPLKRAYYELIAIKTHLSVRELRRQISTLSFERTGLSKNKELSLEKIASAVKPFAITDAIKDIYVFDFLNLPNYSGIEESDLETALLDHLQAFMLELGHGFCFEARQKKILIGDRYYFIDLVFYHRILKCHVLIDLKVEEFTHTNAGQLNTYLSYYKAEEIEADDNPPVGILLVTDKSKALVEYATAGMDNTLFVSKYLVQLPSKEQLEEVVQSELNKL